MMRLTLPSAFISGLLLTVGVAAAWYVHRIQDDVSEMLAENITSVRAAEEFEIGMREVRTKIVLYLLTGDRKHLEAVPELRQITAYWLQEADRLGTTSPEQELMIKVKESYRKFFVEFEHIQQQDPTMASHKKLLTVIDDLLATEILPPAHEYLAFNEQQVAQTTKRNQATGTWLITGLLTLGT